MSHSKNEQSTDKIERKRRYLGSILLFAAVFSLMTMCAPEREFDYWQSIGDNIGHDGTDDHHDHDDHDDHDDDHDSDHDSDHPDGGMMDGGDQDSETEELDSSAPPAPRSYQ